MEMEINKKRLALRLSKGFTLIEMIVAVAIFSVFVVSITLVTISVIETQRKIFSVQNIQEAGRFVLESMSKEIRISEIDTGSSSAERLVMTSGIQYWFDSNTKRIFRIDGGGVVAMSPDNMELTGAFWISQLSATISMKIKSIGGKIKEQSDVYLQTTVAPRS